MPPKKNDKKDIRRNTALCYVRQSFTRNAEDMDSPERQRANILAYCEKMGFTPEFYEDADKHKTGTKEKNRPGWLALKERLGDPDVTALVANDLARLHRKGWRVGDLIDYLDQRGVALVLAAPGREIDLSTPMGRLFVQFTAILDEWYAADISQRAKDHVAYRKAQGKSVGMPPFGTHRGSNGYLEPSSEGAWLLPDRSFVAGQKNEPPPQENAVFKGYHEAAQYMLTLYATGQYGLERIAYTLNKAGWAFRDRTGIPRMVWRDDVRRVVANWPEYGGIVMDKSGKDRRAYEAYNVDEIPLRPDRAVFPLELIQGVAQVRHERSRRPVDHGEKRMSYPYPLAGITYCAHCEQQAKDHNNEKLRSRLGGKGGAVTYEKLRYRHKMGISCGAQNRSVLASVYEADFRRLIQRLTIKPEAVELMTELAIQANKERSGDDIDIEEQKREAISVCKRRIEAAVNLYSDGMINRDEYLRRVQTNEQEIAHWEQRTTETEKLAYELAMCLEAIDKVVKLWDMGTDDDRQGFARSLFEYVVYDLDKHRIIDFRLKGWAERFIILRAALEDEDEENEKPEGIASGFSSQGNEMPHRRFELLFWP